MKNKLIAIFFLTSISIFAQSPKRVLKKLGENPVFFIDSMNVDKDELQKYDPKDIAGVTVYKKKEAIDLVGEDGKDGAVYIETITFSKKRYWNFFKSKSEEYLKTVPSPDSDINMQYILNERILDKDFEGTLATINDKLFKQLIILSKEELINQFNVTDKEIGIRIISDTPDNLYKGAKKF